RRARRSTPGRRGAAARREPGTGRALSFDLEVWNTGSRLASDLADHVVERLRVLALVEEGSARRELGRVVVGLATRQEHDPADQVGLGGEDPAVELGAVAAIHVPVTDDHVEVLVLEDRDRAEPALDAHDAIARVV